MLRVTQKGVERRFRGLAEWVYGQKECHTLMWETHEGRVEKVDERFCLGQSFRHVGEGLV